MKLLKTILLIAASVTTSQLSAQETWGMANSNFAGNLGIELNPSSIALSPIKYELNLFSVHVSAQNDYVYVPKKEMSLRKLYKGDFKTDDWKDRYTPSDKNGHMQLLLKGPSFYARMGTTAFGIHASLRSDIDVRNLNYEVAKFLFEGSDYKPQQKLDLLASDNSISALAFGELGATIAQQFKAGTKGKLAFGITLNYLYGLSGAYIKNSGISYSFDNASLLTVPDLNADFGYAMPLGEDHNYFKKRGSGYSTTIGFQYVHNFNPYAYNIHVRKLKKYKYKIGASIIDAGSIRFTTETRTYQFNNNSFVWDGFDTAHVKSADQFAQQLNVKVYDVVDGALKSTSYKAQLPTALSVQFDYSFSSILYVNASLMQPIQSKATGVRRPSQFCVTPRIELWRYEISFPLSMYEYKQFRAGMALRLGQVILGSDYLTALTGLSDFDGLDFYVGIRHSAYATNTMGKSKKKIQNDVEHQPKPNPMMRQAQ